MKTNFHEQVKKVPFLKIVIFYGMGIGLAHFIPAGNATFSILNAILITVLLSQVVWFIMQPRFRSLYIINSYVILFVFGLWNISRTHFKNDANHFHLGASDQFIAIVDDEPIVKNNTVRFSALLRAKETKSTFRKATGNLMMTVELDRTAPIQYGDEIIFINKIKAIPNHYNPLEFDYKNYLANRGIYFQNRLSLGEYKVIGRNKGNRIKALGLNLRQGLVHKFRKYLDDEEAFQIATALIFGYRTTMSTDTLQTFSNTGTIHVLSVSGMHVGIVFLLLLWLLQQVKGNHVLHITRTVLLLLAIWSYTILTGMAPSILRAAIMLSFFLITRLLRREVNILNTLAASAFLLLLFQPNMLFDIGFQLSYSAVLGIVFLFPLYKRIAPYTDGRFSHHIWDSIGISLSAQTSTAPLSLFYFGQFPNYFLIANVLVVLPVTIIMYVGLVLMFLPFDSINIWLGHVLQWLVKYMFLMLKFLDKLPYSTWTGIVLSPIMVFVSLTMLLTLTYAFQWKSKNAMYFSLFILLIFVVIFNYQQHLKLTYKGFRVYNTGKDITLAFIKRNKVTVISSFDSLNTRALKYSIYRDLSRFSNWNRSGYHKLISDDSLRVNYLIQKSDLIIQIMEHATLQVLPTDVLIVRKNSKWNFVDNVKVIKPKIVLFDGTNSDHNIQVWQHQLDSLAIPHYSIKNNFAYVWDKELL